MALTVSPSLALRQDTADLHQRLDADSVMGRLMQDDVSLAVYAAVLQRLLRCHAWVERQLQTWQQGQTELPNWLQPCLYMRSSQIRRDLLALRAAVEPGAGLARSEECLLSTGATAVGMVYVVAGSALGARVIERQLHTMLGPDVTKAVHFLRSGQDGAMPAWARLRACFDEALSSPRAVQQAIWAARQTFAYFLEQLSPPLHDLPRSPKAVVPPRPRPLARLAHA